MDDIKNAIDALVGEDPTQASRAETLFSELLPDPAKAEEFVSHLAKALLPNVADCEVRRSDLILLTVVALQLGKRAADQVAILEKSSNGPDRETFEKFMGVYTELMGLIKVIYLFGRADERRFQVEALVKGDWSNVKGN